LNGANLFIGQNVCGTVSNAEQGKWYVVKCKVQGSFIKIQAAPKKYLHFCGLKVWAVSGDLVDETREVKEEAETIDDDEEEPEPVHPVKTSSGATVQPEPEEPKNEWITMSSRWNDDRN